MEKSINKMDEVNNKVPKMIVLLLAVIACGAVAAFGICTMVAGAGNGFSGALTTVVGGLGAWHSLRAAIKLHNR